MGITIEKSSAKELKYNTNMHDWEIFQFFVFAIIEHEAWDRETFKKRAVVWMKNAEWKSDIGNSLSHLSLFKYFGRIESTLRWKMDFMLWLMNHDAKLH